jgi:hypothetical protein
MMKLSRAELYGLVWFQPMTAIAKHYGVRDLQIAQACDLYDIARPPTRYWQKFAHGKKVERIDLPIVNFSADQIVIIEPSRGADSQKSGKRSNRRLGLSHKQAEL